MKSSFKIYISDNFGKSSCFDLTASDWTFSFGGLGPEHNSVKFVIQGGDSAPDGCVVAGGNCH